MNLTVFAGILLAVTMATARRASLGEKTMQAAGEAEEPEEAMRESARPASLVEKIMRAAAEADEPDEAMRAKREKKVESKVEAKWKQRWQMRAKRSEADSEEVNIAERNQADKPKGCYCKIFCLEAWKVC